MPRGNPDTKGQSGIQFHWAAAALFGSCPKCADPTLFEGVAVIAPKCTSCGLDFVRLSEGDGKGVILTFLIWAALVGVAMVVESAFAPPLWVHVILWVPLTFASVFYGLRAAKTAMIYKAYHS